MYLFCTLYVLLIIYFCTLYVSKNSGPGLINLCHVWGVSPAKVILRPLCFCSGIWGKNCGTMALNCRPSKTLSLTFMSLIHVYIYIYIQIKYLYTNICSVSKSGFGFHLSFQRIFPAHKPQAGGQMPSPEEPRFCLITRGWKAMVFLNPAANSSESESLDFQKKNTLLIHAFRFRRLPTHPPPKKNGGCWGSLEADQFAGGVH